MSGFVNNPTDPVEKARYKLVKLRAMAARPGTPAEGENAKARIEQILTKFPQLRGKPAPPTSKPFTSSQDWEDLKRRTAEATRRRQQAAAAAKLKADREAADKRWAQRMADKDANGQPLSAKDRAEAQRDPFSWANKQDGRTHAQKQEDMNKAWGTQQASRRCAKPQSFYDAGGEPRKRNQHVALCEKCGERIQPGEGAILQVAGVWKAWCTETKPGPRRKKPGYDR